MHAVRASDRLSALAARHRVSVDLLDSPADSDSQHFPRVVQRDNYTIRVERKRGRIRLQLVQAPFAVARLASRAAQGRQERCFYGTMTTTRTTMSWLNAPSVASTLESLTAVCPRQHRENKTLAYNHHGGNRDANHVVRRPRARSSRRVRRRAPGCRAARAAAARAATPAAARCAAAALGSVVILVASAPPSTGAHAAMDDSAPPPLRGSGLRGSGPRSPHRAVVPPRYPQRRHCRRCRCAGRRRGRFCEGMRRKIPTGDRGSTTSDDDLWPTLPELSTRRVLASLPSTSELDLCVGAPRAASATAATAATNVSGQPAP